MRLRFVIVASLLAAACASETEIAPEPLPSWPDSHPPDAEARAWTDRILQVSPPQVDVLWVIDNSSSMEDEQSDLVENFPVFADFFVGSGTDYHIGVISTDIVNPQQDGTLHGVDDLLWIDDEVIDPIARFSDMASVGITGSGDEAGLGATFHCLEAKADTVNAGFRRDAAALHTIVITDEEDQTPSSVITPAEFVPWYLGLVHEDEDVTFSSIVSYIDKGAPDPGLRYLGVTAAVGGVEWDIMDPDWATVLERLGVQAAGERMEFFLSHRPVPGSIAVHELGEGGVIIVHEEATFDAEGALLGGAWTFDEARNSIGFVQYVPEAGAALEITYTLSSD